MQNLVIVESPTKARTLSKYLGSKYVVEASMGHVRDLPKSELGIDVEDNFEPRYIIPRDKTKRVNELKKLALQAKTLWLATDPDREGEAIAWHIEALINSRPAKAKSNLKGNKIGDIHRVVFHEITPEAIAEAFKNPRQLDLKLVDAQQARRVLDRLVGYKLSPVLWQKVKSGLSAGRVQSVALRLIVEREREIDAFKSEEYWSIGAKLEASSKNQEVTFVANLIEANNKKVKIKNEKEATSLVDELKQADYLVEKVIKKEIHKSPPPPFTTSTIQQTAANRLGMSAKKTMALAQVLYEHGFITYMRTDSVNLSTQSLSAARSYIEKSLGKVYLPGQARVYKTKSKLAQEAHEAIRPTNIALPSGELKIVEGITRDHIRLYDLIWKRMIACQINEAVFDHTTIDVKAKNYLFRATGSIIKFDGWLKVYGKEVGEDDESEQPLPDVHENDSLKLIELLPEQHFTEPPARYNDASLIKKLEELGIGRPSTYASILSTIQERFYVEKNEKKFFATPLGLAVIDFLVKNFPDIVDYTFTAALEDELDEIAHGQREWKPTIKDFYGPFEKKLEGVVEHADRVKVAEEVVDKKCPDCGKNLQIKYGKFGKFLACTGFPECKHTESLEEKIDIPCPQCGGQVVLRKTHKGRPFYGCKNWPNCKFASWTKPKGDNKTQTTEDSKKDIDKV